MAVPVKPLPLSPGLDWTNSLMPAAPAPSINPDVATAAPSEATAPPPNPFINPEPEAAPVAAPVTPPPAGSSEAVASAVLAASPERQAEIDRASAMKTLLLSGSRSLDDAALAATEGNERSFTEMEYDLRTLTDGQFASKYGAEAAEYRQHYRNAEGRNRSDALAPGRSGTDLFEDLVTGATKGFATGIGSLATLGGAVVDAELGVTIAEANQSMGEWFDDRRSERGQRNQERGQRIDALDAEENKARYERAIANGEDETIASLEYLGRSFMSQMGNLANDPGRVFDVATEGVGSLIGSAGIGGITAKLVSRGLGKQAASSLASRAATSGVLGLMEGGDAYGNAAGSVMEMTEDQLNSRSEDYRALREEGLSHADAQLELAHNAGLIAAGVAIPIAAASGALVSRFEANPLGALKGRGLTDIGWTGVTQFAEEAVQGGGNQLASNLGVREAGVDPTRPLVEGVGESAALEAVGGGLTGLGVRGAAGVLNAPAAIAAAVRGEDEDGMSRADRRALQNNENMKEALAYASNQAKNALAEQAVANPQETITEDGEVITAPGSTEAGEADIDRTVADIRSLFEITDERDVAPATDTVADYMFTPSAPGEVSEETLPKPQVLRNLALALDKGELTGDDAAQAKLYLQTELSNMESLLSGDIRARAKALPEFSGQFEEIEKSVRAIRNSKAVRNTLNTPLTDEQVTSLNNMVEVTPENAGSKAVRNMVMNHVRLSGLSPEKVNPENARIILNHAREGRVNLTPQQQNQLDFAATVSEEIKSHAARTGNLKGRQAEMRKRLIEGDPQYSTEPSVLRLVNQINTAIREGNMPAARRRMAQFAAFRYGQNQKVKAIETSRDNGGTDVRHPILTRHGFMEASNPDAPVAYYRGDASESHLRIAMADADLVNRVYDKVKAQYPDLVDESMVSVNRADLVPETNASDAPARQASKSQRASPVRTVTEPKAQKQEAPKPKADKAETGEINLKRQPNAPELPVKPGAAAKYQAKDQRKASVATKFIGRGTKNSSTEAYAKAFGDRANSGKYTADDVVMSSAQGGDKGRIGFNRAEMSRAMEAGATILTDVKADRDRNYNVGEREVAEFLSENGYSEVRPGLWRPLVQPVVQKTPKSEVPKAPEGRRKGMKDLLIEQEEAARLAETPTETPVSTEPEYQINTEDPISALVPKTPETELFHAAYEHDEGVSKLSGVDLSLDRAVELLNDLPDDDRKEFLEKLITEQVPAMVDKFQDRFNSFMNRVLPIKKSDPNYGKTVKQLLEEGYVSEGGNKINEFRNGRILNFAFKDEDGNYQLPQSLLQVASLATFSWLFTEAKPAYDSVDVNDVAKSFGIDPDEVTPDMMTAFRAGTNHQQAALRLAQTMERFMGIRSKNDETRSNAGGMMLGLATEMLDMISDTDLVHEVDGTTQTTNHKDSYNWVTYETFKFLVPGTSETDAERSRSLKVLSIKNEMILDMKKMLGLKDDAEGIIGQVDALERAIINDPDTPFHIGKAPTKIARTQMKNNLDALTRVEQEAIQKEQEKAYYLNLPVISMMEGIGEAAWKALMGFEVVRDRKFNKRHLRSVEGKNTSIQYGWDGVKDYVQRVKDFAKDAIPLDQVPIFFEFGVSKVGRLQQRGFGPQGDKQARQAIATTWATLDMNQKEAQDSFWMTVAQAMGIKTEQVPRAKAVADAQAMFRENPSLVEATSMIQALLKRREAEPSYVMSRTDQEKLVKLLKLNPKKDDRSKVGLKEINPKVMEGIMSVARLNLAREAGSLGSFRHGLALESDGKTDGPINALMNYLAGAFSERQLQLLAKGGMFLNRIGRTLNMHFGADGNDLYKDTAIRLQEILSMKVNMPGEVGILFRNNLRLLTETGDISFDGKNIVIERGMIKNPLTVSVYGAGQAGIAGKIVNALLDNVQERMTMLARTNDTNKALLDDPVFQLLMSMSSRRVWKDMEGNMGVTDGKKHGWKPMFIPKDMTPSTFELNRKTRSQLVHNVNMLFANDLVKAIDTMATSGNDGANVKGTMKLMQKATQIQSAVIQKRFADLVQERKKELPAGRDLSNDDYTAIMREVAPYGAVVHMPTQTANMSVSETMDFDGDSPSYAATSMSQRIKGNLVSNAPSDAGVKAAPFMVIMTGDGQMILRLASNGLEKTLMVFDGVEMAADMIDSQSLEINKQVSEGWMQEYVSNMVESFEKFLALDPLDQMDVDLAFKISAAFDPQMRNADGQKSLTNRMAELNEVIQKVNTDLAAMDADEQEASNPKRRETLEAMKQDAEAELNRLLDGDYQSIGAISKDRMPAALNNILEDLRETAYSIKARKAVMNEMAFSVDHMASGEKPYDNPNGKIITYDDLRKITGERKKKGDPDGNTPLDDADLAIWMNARYEAHLAALRKGRNSVVDVEPVEAGMVRDLKAAGVSLNKSGTAWSASVDQMFSLLPKLLHITGSQRDMMMSALKHLKKSGYEFHFGKPTVMARLRNQKNPDLRGVKMALGQIDPITKNIYVTNMTAETLLHETIHAATFNQTLAAILDPSSVNQQTNDAVNRTMVLMDQFLKTDFFSLLRSNNGIDAQSQIQELVNRGDAVSLAMALNEFMAWSLSNQHLIDLMKKTKVQNPLARLVYRVIRSMARIIGLDVKTDSMYAQVRFNAEIIMQDQMDYPKTDTTVLMNHTRGADVHTGRVLAKMSEKLDVHMKKMGPLDVNNEHDAYIHAYNVTNLFQQQGFKMSDQQRQTFATIQNAFSTTMELDRPSLLRAQELYTHVMKNITPESFVNETTNETEAKAKYNLLTGSGMIWKDGLKRSQLLSGFVALSQVDPEFREMLEGFGAPDRTSSVGDRQYTNTFDWIGGQVFDFISDKLNQTLWTGRDTDASVRRSMDDLMDRLAMIENDNRTIVERASDKFDDVVNTHFVEKTQAVLDKGIEKLEQIRQDTNSHMVKTVAFAAQAVGSVFSKEYAEAYGDMVTEWFNKGSAPNVIREFIAEVRGTTSSNEKIHDMVNRVKTQVSAVRQEFRERLPSILIEKFKTTLTGKEWATMSRGLAAPDIGSLHTEYSIAELRDIYADEDVRRAEEARIMAEITAMDREASTIEQKSSVLARYLVIGENTSRHMLRNSRAIALLLGATSSRNRTADPVLMEKIDHLVSLKAIGHINSLDRDFIAKKMATEPEAMDMVVKFMAYLNDQEMKKDVSDRVKNNHIKGRVDVVTADTGSVIVAPRHKAKELARMSYSIMGDFRGDETVLERIRDNNDPVEREGLNADADLVYYYSPVNGKAPYHQGVMQTVQKTMYGVDGTTGYTVGAGSGSRIFGKKAKKYKEYMANLRKDNLPAGEYLQPIFDDANELIAYERTLDPVFTNKIKKDEHLATRLGAWRGRQAEEKLSSKHNETLVNTLKSEYVKDVKAGKGNQYIDLADPNQRDKVHDYIWSIIPKEMKTQINNVFGEWEVASDEDPRWETDPNFDGMILKAEHFYVRRDLINDALGYPGASVGDVFTGVTRLNPVVAQTVEKAATMVFGAKAYSNLVLTERAVQSVVTGAKVTMVIKSGIVPVANIVSNTVQLMMRGVPVRSFGKPLATKIAETNAYLRNLQRMAVIETEAAAYKDNESVVKRLRAEYVSIQDSNKRMSIWPLIEAGEFNSIADGLSEADKVIHNHQIMDKIEELIDKMPKGVKDVTQWAIVSRNTELFKLLNRSVQYGDFLSKALLYEHEISKGSKPEDAYRAIRNEFVNYNLLPGRTRTALESLGLKWFYNFKIRSMKVAVQIIRDNPLKALIWANVPVGDILHPSMAGNVLSDNLATKAYEGTLQRSLGPDLVRMIYEGNLWVRLFG